MVVDPDASYYFKHFAKPARQCSFANDTRIKLNKTGLPFECYCLNDIPKIPNLDKIKFVLMPCPWEITPEKEAMLQKYLLNNNRLVLFMYAPGLSDGTSLDENRCKKWIGKELAQCNGLEVNNMGSWTSAFIRNPFDLQAKDLKDLACKAGVHIYCQDEVPIFANNRFMAVHCKEAKELTLTLPNGYFFKKELYTDKEYPSNTSQISWQTDGPETLLFELEQI